MKKENASAFLCGLLFSVGLGLAGMTQPQKVLGFLDILGAWDPSLLFVMAGAVLVYSLGFRRVSRRSSPLFTSSFLIPSSRQINWQLISGAALFGMGWGIAGFCPGPAIASLATLGSSQLIFGISLLITVFVFEQWQVLKGKT